MKRYSALWVWGVIGGIVWGGRPAPAQPPPPYSFSVHSIKFNHDTNSNSSDGVTIRDSSETIAIAAPEWSSSRNKPVAYIKSSAKTIQVKFTCTEDSVTQQTIWATKSGGNLLGNLAPKTIYFENGVSEPEYQSFAIDSSDVPNFVTSGTVQWEWKWSYYGGHTGSMGYTGPHSVFVLTAAPQEPEAVPHTTILGYACTWASGQQSGDRNICLAIMDNGISENYRYQGNCGALTGTFIRSVASLGVNGVIQHNWYANSYPDGMAAGVMYQQKTREIPLTGITPPRAEVWNGHIWAQRGSYQYDASTSSEFEGTWGEYEDFVYVQYDSVKTWPSPFAHVFVDNRSGQSHGVENYSANKCRYWNSSTSDPLAVIGGWISPNR